MSIVKTPIFLDLDRRRELVFDLNTERLIQGVNAEIGGLWTKIGERENPKTGKLEELCDVNLDNLRTYLWACLYRDAHAKGELLTLEDVGAFIDRRKKVTLAYLAVRKALDIYYGRDQEGK